MSFLSLPWLEPHEEEVIRKFRPLIKKWTNEDGTLTKAATGGGWYQQAQNAGHNLYKADKRQRDSKPKQQQQEEIKAARPPVLPRCDLQVKDTDRSQREVERLDSFINTWIDKHEEYNPDDDNFVSKAFHEAELHQLDSIMQEQQVQHDAAIELRERQKDDYMKLLERNKVLKDEQDERYLMLVEEMAQARTGSQFSLQQEREERARLEADWKRQKSGYNCDIAKLEAALARADLSSQEAVSGVATQLQTKKTEVARLSKTLALMEQAASSVDTKVAHARKEVAAERSKTDAVRESAKLEKEAASHREAALSDEIRKLKAELSALQAQHATAGPSPAPSSVEIDRLRHELQSALATVSRLSPLQGQLKQSHARLAPANHRIRALEQSLTSATAELSKLKREAVLKVNEVQLVSALARKEAQQESAYMLATVQQSLDQALTDLKSLQVNSLALKDSLSRLTEELANTKSDNAAKAKELCITRTDIAILQQSRAIPSSARLSHASLL